MRTRSQLLALTDVPANHRSKHALRGGNIAKALWYSENTLNRIDDLERERAEIRRLIRRLNRRHLRMCGVSSFKNA